MPIPLIKKISPQHQQALEQAVAWIYKNSEPVGILVSGSIIRGNPNPSSDLDFAILHDQPWRQRRQRWFNRIPTEMFFNTEPWLTYETLTNTFDGRAIMAHMLSTGIILHDTNGRLQSLQNRATTLLQNGPNLTAATLQRERYSAASLVEDAIDFGSSASLDAYQSRATAVVALVRYFFLQHNQFLPRAKERLQLLKAIDPTLAQLLGDALMSTTTAEVANTALQEAALRILNEVGFFEWDSEQDLSAPPR